MNVSPSPAGHLFFDRFEKFVFKKKLDRNFQISDFKNRKIENFENRKIFEGFQLNFFEFSNSKFFEFSDFRKISIEILRKIFDFQNFRFFDFSKIFQLRRFFSTKIFATCSLIFSLNRCKIFRCLRKVRREIARTQCRGVRER